MIPLPLPFPRLPWVNAYVIRATGGVVVVDCGVDSPEGMSALEAGLHDLGLTVSDISVVVGTHLHVDHVGMAARVVDVSGARFVMHRAVATRFDEYDDWTRIDEFVRTLAAHHGAGDPEVAEIGAALPRPDWAPVAARPDTYTEDGGRIALTDDRYLEILYTPGHEPSHISLVDSASGILFSGDHVLPRITPVIQYHPDQDRLAIYLESLERIEQLGAELTLPAHGPPIERGSLRARQILLHHERRLGAAMQEVRHRGPVTAWALMGSLFRPHLERLEQRLAFLETLAHLEHLVRREEIERVDDNGVWHFRLPERRRRRATG